MGCEVAIESDIHLDEMDVTCGTKATAEGLGGSVNMCRVWGRNIWVQKNV